jgi:hypothetical protein
MAITQEFAIMEEKPAQVQTFVGYERDIADAIKSAQNQVNHWLAYRKLPPDKVQIIPQTVAEVIPSRDHIFYLYIITVVYQAG